MKQVPKYNQMQRDQSGYMLVAAVFFMLVAALAVATLMRVAATQQNLMAQTTLEKQAQAASESGIEWVLWYIRNERACPSAADRQFSIDSGAVEPMQVSVDCTVSLHQDVAFVRQIWRLSATATYGALGQPEHINRSSQKLFTQPLPLL